MVSAVESMAANTSWSALGKATDLRNRILFTLGLLIVYRLGTFIPVPGIDGTALRQFMESAGQGIGGMVSMFTGGALGRMGIFALGIMPYISASIIVQLLTAMVPALEQLRVGNNALHGFIPTEVADSLRILHLNENQLSGVIPSSS